MTSKPGTITGALAPYASPAPASRANVVPFPLDPAVFPNRTLPVNLEGLESAADGIERPKLPLLDVRPIKKECAFIRDALETGGENYSEPLWNLTTLAATFLEDGSALAHAMGSKHPEYTRETTEEKWQQKLNAREAKDLGWPTCEKIHSAGCTRCGSCPHFGQIKSPLTFGLPSVTPLTADYGGNNQQAAPVTVLFVPGTEQKCREQLDHVVSKDPLTFTLGGPAGPLVILRTPNKEALPRQTQWEGDLPGTTLATTADIMQRAEVIVWMRRGPRGLYRARPPRDFINDYLVQMRGKYGARPLLGVVRVPRIDDSGHIHFMSGYDAETGLFHDKPLNFDVPLSPTLADARRATKALLLPFSEYHFDDLARGRALLLAAIFTAIERPFLPVVPMFVVRSSMPGTGKGLIVRSLVRLAFDTVPAVVTWGGNNEEFEKRLGALLLQAPGALSIDNANGIQIKGDLLEAILTEGGADIRPLGRSETIKVRNRSLITLTGNNPVITGDMARRALAIDILPRSADPERDRYSFNPTEFIQRNRPNLLQAAFIAMRAFRLAGMPAPKGLPAVGSFEVWSRRVRDLVYCLTDYDVSEAFHQNKEEDPRRQDDAALMAALHDEYGSAPFQSSDVFAVYSKVSQVKRGIASATAKEIALYDAIERVLGSKRVDAKLFGYWARRVKGAHIGNFLLQAKLDPVTNTNVFTIRRR